MRCRVFYLDGLEVEAELQVAQRGATIGQTYRLAEYCRIS
jgi:hypothetical protein